MPFRFVHTADIHLDSPLRSLSLRDPVLAALIGDAGRRAFTAVVDLCLRENVDALVIAGDLYDGDQTSMKTARFLAAELGRLDEAGIATYLIRGNHDAMSKISAELALPPRVTLFSDAAEQVLVERAGLTLAFQGLSFAKPRAPESLLPKYRPPLGDAVNIGIMHTSLGGAPGHDVYAPCSLAELDRSGFDYWALGHIHQRAVHEGQATVVMPGMPQGRDINEAGPKSATLVTIHDDRRVTVEERPTSIAEFRRVAVVLDGVEDWTGFAAALEQALASVRSDTASDHLVARLTLTGATPLAYRLRRDRDLALAEAQRQAEATGRSFIDRLEFAVEAPASGTATRGDPVAELAALMIEPEKDGAGGGDPALREEIGKLAQELRNLLPPEARGFAGDDEAGFARFIDRMIAEGGADMIARLGARESGGES